MGGSLSPHCALPGFAGKKKRGQTLRTKAPFTSPTYQDLPISMAPGTFMLVTMNGF